MAGSSGYENLHSESDVNHAISDRDPLLNERPGAVLLTSQDHMVVHIPADTEPSDEEQYQTLLSQSHQRSTSDTDVAVVVPFDSSRSTHVTEPQSPSSVALRNISDSGVDEFSDSGNGYGSRHRTNPLNSGLWILMELTITVSQIVASVIVLALSRHEKPQAPLHVWVVGYAVGCFATLPLLYWRYRHRYFHIPPEHDFISGHPSAPLPVGVSTVPHFSQAEDSVGVFQSSLGGQDAASFDNRMNIFVERFKMALDCFFAIWFVVGNVWIFGGHSSSSEAPNLYRLCIVFLTFSCIGYAMPFILCATICCCLPCIISLLGFREDQAQTKGASSEVINSLPTYKFKGKNSCKVAELVDDVESDSDSICEGGFIAAGTENERAVSGDDAICCICLHKYKNDVELRELPCSHHFHVECVDKWLKINATCPLCKHEIGDSSDTGPETVATVTDRAFQSNAV